MPVLKNMLVIDAPKPVSKSDIATTKDLCLSNFLMLREELLLVFLIFSFINICIIHDHFDKLKSLISSN